MNHKIIKYNPLKYNFDSLISEVLELPDLTMLHKYDREYDLFKSGADSETIFHEKFYRKYKEGWPEFDNLYKEFIREHIAPTCINSPFAYQTMPTIRFSLPDNVAVGGFHTDVEYLHPRFETNFIVPLTNSRGASCIWIESEPGKKDYHPIEMKIGEYIAFKGGEFSHGNKINDTGLTRVSFDFRCILVEDLKNQNINESLTTKTKFKIGAYYKLFEG